MLSTRPGFVAAAAAPSPLWRTAPTPATSPQSAPPPSACAAKPATRLGRAAVRRAEPPPLAPTLPARDSETSRDALELLYEAAKQQEKGGNVRNAVRMFESLLALDAGNGRAWVRRAGLSMRERDWDGARDVLKRGLRFNPGNAILWQCWADMEKRKGRAAVARALFRKGLEANSSMGSLYHSWGGMEYSEGNVGDARALYVLGLKRCPDAIRLYHALGVLEDRAGRVGSARDVLTRGLGREPDNAYLHHAIGVLEYRQRRIRRARECFRRATAVDPRHTLSWLSRAHLEEFEGNVDLARKYYLAGCEVRGSGAVQIWQAWARMEEKLGERAAALALYERAIRAYPRDAMLYCAWGKLLTAGGEVTKATTAFKTGLQYCPKVAYLWQSLALLEEAQGDTAAARDLYARGKAASEGKEVAALIHAWAVLEWKDGVGDVARELFGEAVGVDPKCGWLWLWFGRFEADYANSDLARHYFARSINVDGSDGSPWRSWAELERQEGNEDKARALFRRARDLDSRRDLYNNDPQSPLKRPWRKL